MKAIAYFRCSTPGQATEGVSLETQEAACQRWADQNKAEIVAKFVDGGISGKSMENRDELKRAVEMACQQQVPMVVYDLSRFSRSLKDTLIVEEVLRRAGSALIPATGQRFDMDEPEGVLRFQLDGMLAEFERRKIARRTKLAMAFKKSRGELVGSVPFGYDLDEKENARRNSPCSCGSGKPFRKCCGKGLGVKLMANEKEQQMIVAMRNWRDMGYSLRTICERLTEQGIRTKKGRAWQASTVRQLLKNVA